MPLIPTKETTMRAICSYGRIRVDQAYKIVGNGPDYLLVSIGGAAQAVPKWVFVNEPAVCSDRDARLLRRIERFAREPVTDDRQSEHVLRAKAG
jgi:hypothetical protein